MKRKDTLLLWAPGYKTIQVEVLRSSNYIYVARHQKLVWDHAEDLEFSSPRSSFRTVSVIMLMYITGRNEFKCFVRLSESWFPICGSTCCLCVLISCRGFRRTQPSADLQGCVRDEKRVSLFLTATPAVFSSLYFGFDRSRRTAFFLILWCSIQCVFLMWNN